MKSSLRFAFAAELLCVLSCFSAYGAGGLPSGTPVSCSDVAQACKVEPGARVTAATDHVEVSLPVICGSTRKRVSLRLDALAPQPPKLGRGSALVSAAKGEKDWARVWADFGDQKFYNSRMVNGQLVAELATRHFCKVCDENAADAANCHWDRQRDDAWAMPVEGKYDMPCAELNELLTGLAGPAKPLNAVTGTRAWTETAHIQRFEDSKLMMWKGRPSVCYAGEKPPRIWDASDYSCAMTVLETREAFASGSAVPYGDYVLTPKGKPEPTGFMIRGEQGSAWLIPTTQTNGSTKWCGITQRVNESNGESESVYSEAFSPKLAGQTSVHFAFDGPAGSTPNLHCDFQSTTSRQTLGCDRPASAARRPVREIAFTRSQTSPNPDCARAIDTAMQARFTHLQRIVRSAVEAAAATDRADKIKRHKEAEITPARGSYLLAYNVASRWPSAAALGGLQAVDLEKRCSANPKSRALFKGLVGQLTAIDAFPGRGRDALREAVGLNANWEEISRTLSKGAP